MSPTSAETLALNPRERALEHLMLALLNHGIHSIAFASVAPDDDGVAVQFARISAAAGARTVYLSFVNFGAAQGDDLVAWRVNGAGQIDRSQDENGQVNLVSLAWQPATEASGSGLIAEPSRLRAALERDFGAFDCLVCNLPPLMGAASDAPNPLSIAKACDGLVLVVTAMTNKLDTVAEAVAGIRRAGVNLIGTVLDERHAGPDKAIRLAKREMANQT